MFNNKTTQPIPTSTLPPSILLPLIPNVTCVSRKDKRHESVDVLMNKVGRNLKIVPKIVEFSEHFWTKAPKIFENTWTKMPTF